MSFRDNGTGIPDDIVTKIFDPFFTTKDVEKGTGLGLSISHSIIEQHQGTMTIESVLGEYTEFLIRIPFVTIKQDDLALSE
jgi:two-component system NtrC family sensor kinase